MRCNQTIRAGAVALLVSGCLWTAPADGGQPDAVEVRPTPKVVHTPKGVEIQRGNGVEVSRFDTVSLNVKDADLASVLELLSVQGQRNIVPSPKVSGKVTANLYDVTFYEALDAILQQNGAGYIEKGSFIYVYTNEELKKIRDAERQLVHRIFRLNFITAEDAAAFASPLLSPSGKVTSIKPVSEGFQPDMQNGGSNSNAGGEVMLVRDYPENLNEVIKIIAELDTAPSQVLVEATILQASLTEDLALGVDLAILADIGVDTLGGSSPLGAVGQMISGSVQDTPSGAVTTSVGNVNSGAGGIKVGILTNNVAAFIRALDEVTDTTVLANPKVMTLNRQRAEVLVGDKIAYLSTTATATATTQTVEFLETGTQLTLRPFVSQDGRIRLELKPSISSAELREAGSGESTVTLPDETTQELTTNVMVRDGQTVVLGGLFQEQTTITRRQVPGLGDIPIAGWAFKGKDDSVQRSEVIFLITPHIVKDSGLAAAGDSVMEDIEKLRLGAREGLLPWSRSKMTAGHVRDALGHLEKGERDEALWELDLALSLDPSMVEARRLKEKLTGQRVYRPTGGLLDEAIDMMVDDQAGHRRREQVEVEPDPLPTLPQRPEGFVPGAAEPEPPAPELDLVPVPVPPPATDLSDEPSAEVEPDPAPRGDREDPAPAPLPRDEDPMEIRANEPDRDTDSENR